MSHPWHGFSTRDSVRGPSRPRVGNPCHVVIAALLPLTPLAHAQTDPAGWSLNWADEFDGATLNTARWENLDRRDSYNNEKQYYTPNQVGVVDGKLQITATNQPLQGKAYRSGLVRTWSEQTYGRWEIRASLPTTQGMWPAIWLLPRTADWPTGGEIDIMENRGSQPNLVSSAYHYGPSVQGHQYVHRDFNTAANGAVGGFHGNMHTYAVEWDHARIRFFVDGVPSYTFYRNAAPISSTPMSLIINLAIGGDFGGDPNHTTVWPQRMEVDYVRVYSRNAATRALDNESFENTSGALFTGWDEYSNGGNVLPDAVAANARTGARAVQMYGRFNGTNTSGLFQEVAASPGEVWQIGAWSQNRPGDALQGGNAARIKLEFINNQGAVIGEAHRFDVADADSPSFYRENVLRRTAPAGTVFARAVLEMSQVNNAGGAVNFDDATLRRWIPDTQAGDINLDGAVDAADLDALLHSLHAPNTAFDFDGNAAINDADFDAFLAATFGTIRGDANLDQAVNFDDLLVLAQNYGNLGTWATGDFTGDSFVDFDDLLTLAQHYGSPASFESDWALAQSLVPEPASLGAIGLVALLSQRQRPRRATERGQTH